MVLLAMKIRPITKIGRKVRVEIDVNQFERLAANFGFFNPEFIESIDRAERDYSAGRARKISSLRELR